MSNPLPPPHDPSGDVNARFADQLVRRMDFTIPVWSVVVLVGGMIGSLVSNYYSTQQLIKDVAALQVTSASNNTAMAAQFQALSREVQTLTLESRDLSLRTTISERTLERVQGQVLAAGAIAKANATAAVSR